MNESILILSTANVTERDASAMASLHHSHSNFGSFPGKSDGVISSTSEFGIVFKLKDSVEENLDSFGLLRDVHFTDSMIGVLYYAIAQGYKQVVFDRDNPASDLVPSFDWG